jgi:hypothetical protein
MPVIEITKEHIIAAIETEPLATLRGGMWVGRDGAMVDPDSDEDGALRVGSSECHVCAVGAVLRSLLDASAPAYEITRAANAVVGGYITRWPGEGRAFLDKALEACASGRYMNALSIFFEGCDDEEWLRTRTRSRASPCPEDVRADTVRFVRENFPAKIQLTFDSPTARHVRVVED